MKKKLLLVLGILCVVIFAAALTVTIIVSNSTSLVSDTGIRTGQQNNIVEYDADDNILFLGTRTGTFFAFDNATLEVKWQFQNEASSPITCVCVHPETHKVFVGSDDNNLYTFDFTTGELLNTLNVKRRVADVDVTTDESVALLVTQSLDKANVMTFDLNSGEQLTNVKYTYLIKGARLSSDESCAIVCDRRGQVYRMSFDGEEYAKTDAVKSEIYAMKKMPDGTGYFVVDGQGHFAVVSEEDCTVLRSGTVEMVEGALVYSGNIDTEGNVIIGTKQGYCYVLNADNEQIYEFRQADGYTVKDFATDGEVMYLTGYGDYVDHLQLSSLQTIAFLQSIAGVVKVVMIAAAVLALAFFLLYFVPTYKFLCKIGKILWKHKVAYLLLIPTFVLLVLFNYTPMVIALSRAFTNWSQGNYSAADIEFVGLYNFKRMLTEGYFLIGVKNMLILMISGFIKTLTMPIIAAWLVYSFRSDKQKYAFRFMFVLPIVVPGLVGSLLWKQIYNPDGGLDQLLTALGLEEWIHVWLGEEKTAIWSIVFMGPPYIGAMPFLLYYGGLTSIDASLYEAARIDGANRWKIFWRIQIPMIRPQMKLLIMLQFIGSIQDYGGIYLLTGGGPGTATYVPGLELYYNATTFGNYGYACAMGLVMFVIIMIGTFFNNRIKAENYGS